MTFECSAWAKYHVISCLVLIGLGFSYTGANSVGYTLRLTGTNNINEYHVCITVANFILND